MPRSIRIQHPGAFYHVMARGNRRAEIFWDDDDRRFFLKAMGEACAMTGWRIHAWVLMSNHYHVVIETPEANLVAGMQWLQNTYTRRFNVRHHLWGRLFGDRYKSVLVEGAGYYYDESALRGVPQESTFRTLKGRLGGEFRFRRRHSVANQRQRTSRGEALPEKRQPAGFIAAHRSIPRQKHPSGSDCLPCQHSIEGVAMDCPRKLMGGSSYICIKRHQQKSRALASAGRSSG